MIGRESARPRRSGRAPRRGLALDELARELPDAADVAGDAAVRVRGVRHDSRAVEPGDLFVARRGEKVDGARFVRDAVARGAAAVHGRARGARRAGARACRSLVVDDPAAALGFAASAVYGHPSFALEVVGITGTNGKTTTAHLVRAAIDGALGRPRCGVLGTVGHSLRRLVAPTPSTRRPRPTTSRATMAEMRARGATHVAMEVSSHALALGRVRARALPRRRAHEPHAGPPRLPRLDGGVRRGQGAPLHRARPGRGRPERGRRVRARPGAARVKAPLVRVSARVDAPDARHRARATCARRRDGIERHRAHARRRRRRSPRASSARTTSRTCSSRWASRTPSSSTSARAADALSREPGAPGRLERCDGDGRRRDRARRLRAHPRRARARARRGARRDARAGVWCVFGCGGDRDATKRGADGRGGRRGAPTWPSSRATTRGPRTRQPSPTPSSRGARAAGMRARRRARPPEGHRPRRPFCVSRATSSLIAGKGHEDYQIVGMVKHPFDDRIEARRALERAGARQGGA